MVLLDWVHPPLENDAGLQKIHPPPDPVRQTVSIPPLGSKGGAIIKECRVGQMYLNLKENPKHKWYYYPNMTTDEVLVFKQAHFRKGQVEGDMPTPHMAICVPREISKL